MKKPDKLIVPGGVEEYIQNCPKEVRPLLQAVRSIIREIAPDAIETVSYFQFPGYSCPGYDYNGMFAWFSFKKPYIRIHVRPPVIKNHAKELNGYLSSTGIVNFPADGKLPFATIKKLVEASLVVMRDK